MEKGQIVGIIATLSIILGAVGTTVFLTEEQANNTYVCTTNEYVGVFHRLSSTEKSGYYYDDDGTERYNICRNGKWVVLKEYLLRTGKTMDDLLQIRDDVTRPINFTVDTSCLDDSYSYQEFSHVFNQTKRCPVINSTCPGQYIERTKIYVTYNVSRTRCTELGLHLDGEYVSYKERGKRSLRTGDILCTWDVDEGGINVESRSEYWKQHIKPGEDGRCVNISQIPRFDKFKGVSRLR